MWESFCSTATSGVGTFENLDGEMIVLDGIVYRAQSERRGHRSLA